VPRLIGGAALVALALVRAPTSAAADDGAPPADVGSGAAPADMSDQGIAAALGVAGGGRTTPGGLRITGHYLYQLTDEDWFDGTISFTFGSGAGACFRDRDDVVICDPGLTGGAAVATGANVRRYLGGRGDFWPFVRFGVSAGLVRFRGDDVSGLAVPLHAGGGFRVTVSPGIAVIAEATLDVGFGLFNRTLGLEPQLGGAVTAGAEFRL
jgi:hypothetical protein